MEAFLISETAESKAKGQRTMGSTASSSASLDEDRMMEGSTQVIPIVWKAFTSPSLESGWQEMWLGLSVKQAWEDCF